jgi:hypothetical protein
MRLFTAERLCVSVEDVDFVNPNRLEDGRECGVRVEVRTVDTDTRPATIYASRALAVGRAVCRFDLLESAPRAQDRMHWHPNMPDGEPCDRVFDTEMRTNPVDFVGAHLRDAVKLLDRCGVPDAATFAPSATALAAITDDIAADIGTTLERIRSTPWPEVSTRDERGMPVHG